VLSSGEEWDMVQKVSYVETQEGIRRRQLKSSILELRGKRRDAQKKDVHPLWVLAAPNFSDPKKKFGGGGGRKKKKREEQQSGGVSGTSGGNFSRGNGGSLGETRSWGGRGVEKIFVLKKKILYIFDIGNGDTSRRKQSGTV